MRTTSNPATRGSTYYETSMSPTASGEKEPKKAKSAGEGLALELHEMDKVLEHLGHAG
jgi:hypothetical protein